MTRKLFSMLSVVGLITRYIIPLKSLTLIHGIVKTALLYLLPLFQKEKATMLVVNVIKLYPYPYVIE